MAGWLVALHVTTAMLAAGVLFAVSLGVVVAKRLPGESQQEGVKMMLRRLQLGAYYPMLGIAVISGLSQAWITGALSEGRWLHWKLVAVVMLVGLGFVTSHVVITGQVRKSTALSIHISIFLFTALIVFLAVHKPF